MTEPKEVRTGTLNELTTYEKWVRGEGIPIYTGFFVEDLRTLAVEPWERKGGLGAFINLEGTGQTNDAYVCEIPPGRSRRGRCRGSATCQHARRQWRRSFSLLS